jgi:hypothetical protein
MRISLLHRALCISFTFLAIATAAHAQTPELKTEAPAAQKLSAGRVRLIPTVYVGAGMLRMTGDNFDFEKRPGASYGIALFTEFSGDRLSFLTGARFLRQSARIHSSSSTPYYSWDSSSNLQLDTIGIPLFAKFKTIRVGSGPAFSLTLGAEPVYQSGLTQEHKATYVQEGRRREVDDSYWLKDWLRAVNVLGVGAIGMELPSANGNDVTFALTYNRTLLPILRFDDPTKLYIDSLLFSAGVAL